MLLKSKIHPLAIAVIGSGTSGLAVSAFLKKDGHDITIFEKFKEPRPLGAGLLLQPTGLACLAQLGLAEKVLQRGAIIRHLYGKSANGRIVFDISYAKLKPHFFGLGIHRGALFSILYDEVQRLNVPIKASCDITKTQIENEKHILKDKTGNHYGPFDLVIDASGMHSSLRDENGQIKYNKPYPYGAIWGVCEDPGQSFGKDYLQQRYDGAKMMIGMLSIGKRPSDGKEALTFFWSLPVSTYNQWRETGLDSWKVKVLGYWPELEPFLKQFQSVDDLTFAQYSDIIMDRWHCDRLVFIGDAAHCTSPQLGQGANLGLIDALILSTCLRKNKDVNEAIAQYTKARKNHIYFYQMVSRWLTPFFQSDSTAAAWVRDRSFNLLCKTPYLHTEMLRTLAGIKTGLFTHFNPGEWHSDYDLKRRS